MGFLTPALLGGAALIAVPIVLHLVMRRQPKRLEFPALQFVRKRQHANRRRLNFRHLLLLALRCALIAGLAIALARPTLQGSGLRGKEGAPLAVALVLDNSVRMEYVFENRTRLEQAKEMAQWLVEKLPEETQVAIVDRSRASSGYVADMGVAESRVRTLNAENNPRPLEDAVREAIELVAQEEDFRQEVFLFSDLNATSLNEAAVAAISESLAAAPDVRLYLVDVGVEEIRNRSLGPLELRANTLRPGEPLHLRVPIESIGFFDAPLVELYLQNSKSQPVKRGQRLAELSTEGSSQLVFEIGDLPLGTHQGFIQIAETDPLEVDNKRYFTVEVRPAAKVLLLGERESDTLFLREALSPSLMTDPSAARFECQVERFSNTSKIDLTAFEAVCLVDPPSLSDELWQALADYANRGGGVGIFLGHRARADEFNNSEAQRLLPGPLKRKSRYETYFQPQNLNHPALNGLSNYAEEIPWQVYPVLEYWEFGEPAGDAYVVARFANGQPAFVERQVGRGRVLTFATAVSDPLEPAGRQPWNLLPTGPEPWPFVALMNELVGYLSQSEEESLDYFAGETVSLRLAPREQVSSFVLYQPQSQPQRRTLPPGEDAIRISTTNTLGNYRVASGGEESQLDRGFSVNVAPEISRLERLSPEQLADVLPAEQVQIARTLTDVELYVDIGRTGRGLFPWLISLVALVWGTEHVLANRFYREAQ